MLYREIIAVCYHILTQSYTELKAELLKMKVVVLIVNAEL